MLARIAGLGMSEADAPRPNPHSGDVAGELEAAGDHHLAPAARAEIAPVDRQELVDGGPAGEVVAHPGECHPGQDVLMVEQALERAAQIRRDLGGHPERTDLSDGVPLRDADRESRRPAPPA